MWKDASVQKGLNVFLDKCVDLLVRECCIICFTLPLMYPSAFFLFFSILTFAPTVVYWTNKKPAEKI